MAHHIYFKHLGFAFIGLIAFVIIGFIGLAGYYVWEIKFGDADRLALQFSDQFTTVDGRNGPGNAIEEDTERIIRPHNPIFGNTSAHVAVVMFIDFQCPFCQQSYPITQDIMEQFEPGVRFVFKHFPLSSIHPEARQAAIAATCAHEQGKFWEYYTRIFETQQIDSKSLNEHAALVGLDPIVFTQCQNIERHQSWIEEDFADGAAVGVRGTPTYFINGRRVEGVASERAWKRLILTEMQTTE